MLVVYLLSHGGAMLSFQMPCKFAAIVPGRLLPISRYRPNWKYSAASPGSSWPFLTRARRSSIGRPFDRGIVGGRRHLQVHAAEEFFVVRQVPGFERGVGLGGSKQVLSAQI